MSKNELNYIKSLALQLQRAKTDWSCFCQMAVQGTLWLAKRYPSTLILVFLTRFHSFSYQVATQLSSQGWPDLILDPILPEKFLGHVISKTWKGINTSNKWYGTEVALAWASTWASLEYIVMKWEKWRAFMVEARRWS